MNSATERAPRILVRRALGVAGLAAGCVAAQACNSSTSSPPTPATVESESPATLMAVVGTAVDTPVVVRVVASNGQPVPNTMVAFSVSGPDSATLNPITTTTDASGTAKTAVTLGTVAGTDTLLAADYGAAPATFILIAEPGHWRSMSAVSGDQQAGSPGTLLPDSLVVEVTDVYGNPVPGVTVDWSASAGTLGTAVTTSDADGLVATTFTLGASPGSESVMAQIGQDFVVFTETSQ